MLDKGHRNLQRTKVARKFRQETGVSERIVWEWLRNSRTTFKFRRQYPFENYALDFYCAEALVCVEIDGAQHFASVDRDEKRDSSLLSAGVLTLRIPSIELFDPQGLLTIKHLDSIVEVCETRTGRKGLRPWEYW